MKGINKVFRLVTFITLIFLLSVHTIEGGRKKSNSTTTENPIEDNESTWDALKSAIDLSLLEHQDKDLHWEVWKSNAELSVDGQLFIGAFNMRKFGIPKINNTTVLNTLVKIITRYDLIAVSEITDRTEKAIKKLMERVNSVSHYPYHYVVSTRVGRTNNKEQYGLIFRPTKIQVKNHFVYNDSETDPFAREPMIAQLIVKDRELELGLVNIHVKPTDAVKEINALVEVQEWIENKLKIKNVIMLGDFNADCSYLPKKSWNKVGLRNMGKFDWLIGDEIDTTVGKTDCAYDRIVITGTFLRNAVVPGSAKAFKFDEAYGLDEKTALQVSDHYPVQFAIQVGSSSAESSANSFRNRPSTYPFANAIASFWDFFTLYP